MSDPDRCPYCGRSLPAVLEQGCGSEEFKHASQERRDALCQMVAEVRRKG